MWQVELKKTISGDSVHRSQIKGQARSAAAILFFCSSSLGAVFVNKACLTHFGFSFPLALMLIQSVLTVGVVHFLMRALPGRFTLVHVAPADYSRLALPIVLCISNVAVGLSALTRVNIPMFSAFRRLTVLFVMTAEYFMLRKKHSASVVAAVVVMSLGALVSALGDVTFTALGYMLVFANNFLTASYLTCIKRAMHDLKMDPFSLMYYTAVFSIPPVFLMGVYFGDIANAYIAYTTRPDIYASPWFLPSLFFVSISALCVNLSTSICTHITSPLTTAVAGQVKNVLQTVLGFFSWGYVLTPLNVAGLLVALSGQIAFAYVKFIEGQQARTDAAVGQEKDSQAKPETHLVPSDSAQQLVVNLHRS